MPRPSRRERVHLGHRLVGLADRGDGAEAWFDNGVRIIADVLVGADGIHSAVRAALFGEEAPDFAGCVAYRGLVPAERIADLGLELGSQSWVGPGGASCALFRLARAAAQFCRLDRARRMEPRGLDRPRHGRPGARRLRGLARAGPNDHCGGRDLLHLGLVRPRPTAALVGRPYDLIGRRLPPDVPVYGPGRGNGDRGRRRARRLSARDGDPAEALLHYERLRLPRVTRLQEMSRANKTRFHLRDGPAQQARDAEWAKAGDRSPDTLRWLYEYDPDAVEPMTG